MPTILIVDDEPVDRELACRCIAKIDGLEILEASDGHEGLELCSHHLPDLVLTDLRMPKLDGLELVRELLEDTKLSMKQIADRCGSRVRILCGVRF